MTSDRQWRWMRFLVIIDPIVNVVCFLLIATCASLACWKGLQGHWISASIYSLAALVGTLVGFWDPAFLRVDIEDEGEETK